jgi:hypothetical protein
MGESTYLDDINGFPQAVIVVFGEQYFRESVTAQYNTPLLVCWLFFFVRAS